MDQCVFRFQESQQHTTYIHASAVNIHYAFHPRAGEEVEIVRRELRQGSLTFRVVQPDGTTALLPAWMCSPEAALMRVTDRPRSRCARRVSAPMVAIAVANHR